MLMYVRLRNVFGRQIIHHIVQICADFGCPSILHTDNGREFKNALMEAFAYIWPDFVHIFGRPRSPHVQVCLCFDLL